MCNIIFFEFVILINNRYNFIDRLMFFVKELIFINDMLIFYKNQFFANVFEK